jgi:O-antigen ligase
MVTQANIHLKSATPTRRFDLRVVAGFVLLAVVGCLAALNPTIVLLLFAALIGLGLCWLALVYMRRVGLELWQIFTIIALSGYLLLNYGFENITLHVGGLPIIVSYALMYGAVILAVYSGRHLVRRALAEPPALFALLLLALTMCHLVFDIPRYAVWAVRDATMCLDAIFMLVGLAWAMKGDGGIAFMSKWMLLLFTTIMFYGFTLPWGERLWAWSPESGVFLKVPVLGNYNGTGDLMLAGALFCICVGGFVIKRPSWLMLVLAAGQFLGVAVTQVRRMYVGAVIVLLILVLLGEGKKFAKLFLLLPVAVGVIALVTTVGGLEINGRIGPVNLDFFKEHIRSIETSDGTPGSSVESRYIMVDQAMQHFYAHPVVGEGFGLPLLNDIDMSNGAAGRQPHNSSLTYLARLGAVGLLLWIAFHVAMVKRFVYTYHQRRTAEPRVYAFVLWFFLFYVLFMLASFVEPPFEFPSGAVPFYFFTGYTLGLIRWQLFPKNHNKRQLTVLVKSAETV